MNKTGSRIRARRLDASVPQRDLAAAVGISPSYLNLIEHDRRRIGGRLLARLAVALDLDPALLTDGADSGIVDRMQAAAAALPSCAVESAQAEDLASRTPGWARLIAVQARRITDLDQRTRALSDRLTYDPALAAALHGVISAVTAIQSTATILTGDRAVDADWQARFHRNILDDAGRLAQTSAALIAYLDAPPGDGSASLSPIEDMEQILALSAFHRPGLEPGAETRQDGARPAPDPVVAPGVATLLQDHDARYADDARALPLEVILPVATGSDFDPLQVASLVGQPLARVMRRLATLPAAAGGPPLGLAICDASGALRLVKPAPGFVLTRGVACPLWPLFTALGQPGRPVTATVSLPGVADLRLLCHAIADITPHPAGPHLPPLIEAVMLVRPLMPASGPARPAGAGRGPTRHTPADGLADSGADPAQGTVPVGPGCRVCPRPACPARREPAAAALAKGFDT